MIFSELYSAYYNTVAEIIKAALDHPLEKNEMGKIVEEHAFAESILTIEPAIEEERWQLVTSKKETIIHNVPEMPLTEIQKRWLKAISLDPRVRLFTDELPEYPDEEPLFTPEDYTVFDKYLDGDDFEDESYRKNFKLILDAIRNQYPIKIKMENRTGRLVKKVLIPRYLEYSEKDDKFRMIAAGKPVGGTYNLGRLRSCVRHEGDYEEEKMKQLPEKRRIVSFEISDERNALERVLLHFAHFEKEAERIGDERHKVSLHYDKEDESEIVIRILSFGPMIKVIEPESFINQIKKRLLRQKSCEL